MSTEKEKMIAGRPYKASDPQLSRERQIAKERLFEFNSVPPGQIERRNELLRQMLGRTGKSFLIEPLFHCDYGYNIEIGENFYSNVNLVILDCARVIIGDNVLIGPNVSIFTAGHPLHFTQRNEGYEYALPVRIGNNIWIGGQVVINPGITIGDNSVVGSGSVVTKDIPKNTVTFGNPCKVQREITEDDRQYYHKDLKFE